MTWGCYLTSPCLCFPTCISGFDSGPLTGCVPQAQAQMAAGSRISSLLALILPVPLEDIHPACAHVETPLCEPFIYCSKEDVSLTQTHLGAAGETRSFSNLSNSSSSGILSAGAERRPWKRKPGRTTGHRARPESRKCPSQPGPPAGATGMRAHRRRDLAITLRAGEQTLSAIPEHKLSAGNVRTAVRVLGRPGSLRPLLLLLLLKNRRFQIWNGEEV